MATVSLKDLVKVYQGDSKQPFQAVNAINLEIRDREFMVFVGPSGCGKSTTLRMIAGLEVITGGEVVIGNRVVNAIAPKDRDISMVFQNYALYPHMTVFDNMAFGLKIRRFPKAEIQQRVDEAAAILGIQDLLYRKPKALSGGQRQRVAVGRSIVRQPKVFLFDEPLSNLDAKMRVQMRSELTKLHQRLNATMIYVTHDQVEAMTMGDRICVMKDGDIMQVDEPIELYNNPANVFVGGFIGSPPMNFFHGQLQEGGRSGLVFLSDKDDSGESFRIELNDPLSRIGRQKLGKSLILGVRPEDIRNVTIEDVSERDQVITAQVDVSEPMGAETFLYLNAAGQSFIARVNGYERHDIGSQAHVRIGFRLTHIFDAESEEVLR